MEATKVLAEDKNPTSGSGCKPEENLVIVSDVPKDDDSSAITASAVVTEGVSGTRIDLESNFESSFGLAIMDKQTGDVRTSASDIVGKVNNSDVLCLSNVRSNESRQLKENGTDSLAGDGNGDGNNGFCVGDFVWGKIKSRLWWPGQIYDPRDASEFAVKHSQEGRLLVAFFGDGSYSWCLPSQLVPFIDNFKQMSSDSSSKSSVNAVQRALDEFGRLVESKMTCKCIPLEKRDHLARPMVVNAGVRAGIIVPEVDANRLSIPEFEPIEVFSKVLNFAKAVSVENAFELGILKSWLSAFYHAKCDYPLSVYSEPLYIEGLEDKDENETVMTNDFSVPIEVPIQGPQEEDWPSSPTFNSAKSPASSDNKIDYRRKQKSLAELMGKHDNEKRKSRKRATVEGGKDDGKLGRKRRIDGSESDDTTEGKPKNIDVVVAHDASFEAEEELEKVSSPRERKKSKYLSPPYTNLNWKIVNSGSKMEPEAEKKITKASSPVVDDETYSDEPLHSRQKFSIFSSDVDILVNELLSEMEFAALDPFYMGKKGSLDMVWAFISAFRSSTYLHGSDHKVYQKRKRVIRKRRSLPSLMANQEKDDEQSVVRSMSKKAGGVSRKRAADNSGLSQSTDDLVSDIRVVRQKLDTITAILENYSCKFSTEEKSSLKDELKRVMDNVETASEKVRLMAVNASS